MRQPKILIAAIVLAVGLVPRVASAQRQAGALEGFGGFRLGDTTTQPSFGGSLAVNLTSNVQVIGEAGRLQDVLPSLIGDVLAFTPVDFYVSALYGEGGLRFIASPRSVMSPYVEGTAGVARLRPGLSGIGRYGGLANAALRLLDRTEPVASVGGGVIIHGGPLAIDLGYRYKKIFANDPLIQALSLGDGLMVSQVRLGIGVRF